MPLQNIQEQTTQYFLYLKVTTSTLLEPIHFSSGTSIQLQQSWGITKNGTVKNITAAVVTEYPELIKIFIKEQEE